MRPSSQPPPLVCGFPLSTIVAHFHPFGPLSSWNIIPLVSRNTSDTPGNITFQIPSFPGKTQKTVEGGEKLKESNQMIENRLKRAIAHIILGDMNLRNVDLDVAVNALIGSLVKNDYIGEENNSILITVNSSDAEKGSQL